MHIGIQICILSSYKINKTHAPEPIDILYSIDCGSALCAAVEWFLSDFVSPLVRAPHLIGLYSLDGLYAFRCLDFHTLKNTLVLVMVCVWHTLLCYWCYLVDFLCNIVFRAIRTHQPDCG